MNTSKVIKAGRTSIGIEFGSTRIKAVLIDESFAPIASGTHDWENRYENGVWTYSDKDIRTGLQGCFASLREDVSSRYGVSLDSTASIGISAMMHGYLAFDENDSLLVPFRTWRNTMTGQAAEELTNALGFNIPQRWSVAHLYQAILNKETHLPQVRFVTTLAGYVHCLLTGKKVLGIGDASGMFPINDTTHGYDKDMINKFDALASSHGFTQKLSDILPQIVPVGESAGTLTESGALLLDPTGSFKAGAVLCPPEGDAQTGMVATNSIKPKTGNVSAGTSIFAMTVLEKNLSAVYKEIDIVTTPCGSPVAMVHCNNCSGDIDAWVKLFTGTLSLFGMDVPKHEIYDKLYAAALDGDLSCGGLTSVNYFSGEHVTGLTSGVPMLLREPNASFNIANLMRSLVYSSMATLKLGMDILTVNEHVSLEKIMAHGGLFKSPVTGQRFLAAALNVPVALMESAGEGGAWGIALLASYCVRDNKDELLYDFLDKRVFKDMTGSCMAPDADDVKGFNDYANSYKAALDVERCATAVCK